MKNLKETFMRCIVAVVLGVILNKVFTSVNKFIWSEKGGEYKIPFIFTVSICEIIIISTIISFIAFIIYFSFDKSEESQKEVSKIYSLVLEFELVLASFIIGTQIFYEDSSKYIGDYDNLKIVASFLFFILFTYIIYYPDKKDKKVPKLLYESRKVFLETIYEYLENMDSFSIIGDWGIGKTVLVENFFYGEYQNKINNKNYGENYELLYIDTSIYSDNQKIVEKIELELDYLFKENGILKNGKSFVDELFFQNNSFLKGIYLYIFSKDSSDEIRAKIKGKIKEIEKQKNKKIVLCLDNLERLNSKERITNLFAIVDEILPTEIKKIYIYDEKEMIKIFSLKKKCFEKNESDFIEYISKYTFNKIEVKDVEIGEVYGDKKWLLDDFLEQFEENEFNKKIEASIKKYYSKEAYDDIEKFSEYLKSEIKLKVDLLIKKLENPRYADNFIKYLQEDIKNNEDKVRYKFEYKLIRDFLPNLDIDLIQKNTFKDSYDDNTMTPKITNNKYSLSTRKLSEKDIEIFIMINLFKLDFLGGTIQNKIDNSIRNAYYESFYLNIGLEETDYYKEIEMLKENSNENLLEILKWLIDFYPKDYLDKIENFFNENPDIKYIISTQDQLYELINLKGLQEFSNKLFKKIELVEYKDKTIDEEKEGDVLRGYKNIFRKYYMLRNLDDISILILLKWGKKKTENYISTQREFTGEKFYKDLSENYEDFFSSLKESLQENKNLLIKTELYEKLEKKLKVLEEFSKLEITEKSLDSEEDFVYRPISKRILQDKFDFFKYFMFNEEGLRINLGNSNYDIFYPKNRIKDCIKELEEEIRNEKNEDIKSRKIMILIEMKRFNDGEKL